MKKRIAMLLALCLLLGLMATALAEPTITASRAGDALAVEWRGVSGACVLMVYLNGWPVSVSNVDGAAGGAKVPLTGAGACSVRLRTPNGCLTAQAETAPAKPTAVPTPVRTEKPTEVVNQTGGDVRDDLAAQVVAQVNDERAKRGLPALRADAALTRAACVRAREIAQSFGHTRPDGSAWSTVSAAAFGENIARGQRTVDKVMAAWMSSDGHRANILRASYGSIGVCAFVSSGVTHWVQLFGK